MEWALTPFQYLPEIKLWLRVSTDAVTDGTEAAIREVLSPELLARADRYRIPARRRQFLESHLFMDRVIRQVLGDELPRWELATLPLSGRSVVRNCSGEQILSVSLSHSGAVTAVACGPANLVVGVDVEIPDDRMNPESLATMALGQMERDRFLTVPLRDRAVVLRQIWTIKESIWKTCGREASPMLSDFETNTRGAQTVSQWHSASGSVYGPWEVQCFGTEREIVFPDTMLISGEASINNQFKASSAAFCGAVSVRFRID